MVLTTFYILYPKATSNTIIVINPSINPIVVKFLFSIEASGNNSEPTKATIAPAEKAKKKAEEKLSRTGLSEQDYKIAKAKLHRAMVRLSVKQ